MKPVLIDATRGTKNYFTFKPKVIFKKTFSVITVNIAFNRSVRHHKSERTKGRKYLPESTEGLQATDKQGERGKGERYGEKKRERMKGL